MGLKRELLKLIEYKSWANEMTFSSLSHLPESALYKERKTNFKTIVSTLNHVYVVDDIFKSHLTGIAHRYSERNTQVCPAFLALLDKQKEMDSWYIDFIEKTSEKDLDKNISFEFIGGGKGNMLISEILFHVVNHGTYHRGFVGDMMYQIPAVPPANDLTVYLRDISSFKRNGYSSI